MDKKNRVYVINGGNRSVHVVAVIADTHCFWFSNVRATQRAIEKEFLSNISSTSSWHEDYKDSAYVFVGGLDFDLTEGDIICVFSQYGEIMDINLVRDKVTGKSKGFAFIAYEDQRSTTLAVDNFNAFKLCGHTLRVQHVSKYRVPKKDEEVKSQDTPESKPSSDYQPSGMPNAIADQYNILVKPKAETVPNEDQRGNKYKTTGLSSEDSNLAMNIKKDSSHSSKYSEERREKQDDGYRDSYKHARRGNDYVEDEIRGDNRYRSESNQYSKDSKRTRDDYYSRREYNGRHADDHYRDRDRTRNRSPQREHARRSRERR